mmetsp:Transcript_18829/g.54610  ORF Transcript_18829/g.54610 Transcript_18829/m.54610 type:complete len:209 (+) Transcript_18829:1491-2117(+)
MGLLVATEQRHHPAVQHSGHYDNQVQPVPEDLRRPCDGALADEEPSLVQNGLQGEFHDVEDKECLVKPEELGQAPAVHHLHDHHDDVDDDDTERDQSEAVAVHKLQALRARRRGARVRVDFLVVVLELLAAQAKLPLVLGQPGLRLLQLGAECVHVPPLRLHPLGAIFQVLPEQRGLLHRGFVQLAHLGVLGTGHRGCGGCPVGARVV